MYQIPGSLIIRKATQKDIDDYIIRNNAKQFNI